MEIMEITTTLKHIDKLSKRHLKFIEIIGVGGISKVWKVQLLKCNITLALKSINKKEIISRKIVKDIFNERNILSKLCHPFIINMYASFQDSSNLYVLMDYAPCGDLRYQMLKMRQFTEEQIKFVCANIICGLDYIHQNNVVHLDIKPENLVFEEKGYLRIADFDLAREVNSVDSERICGTLGYISPEIINRKNALCNSDYFAIGVILYEMVVGDRPFKASSFNGMKEEFRNCCIKVDGGSNGNKEIKYSNELYDLINNLLIIDCTKRIGYNGVQEIKNHPFFKDFNWKRLYHKTMIPPFEVEGFHKKTMSPKKHKNSSNNITNPNSYYNINVNRKKSRKSTEADKFENEMLEMNKMYMDEIDKMNNSEEEEIDESIQKEFLNFSFIHIYKENKDIQFYSEKLRSHCSTKCVITAIKNENTNNNVNVNNANINNNTINNKNSNSNNNSIINSISYNLNSPYQKIKNSTSNKLEMTSKKLAIKLLSKDCEKNYKQDLQNKLLNINDLHFIKKQSHNNICRLNNPISQNRNGKLPIINQNLNKKSTSNSNLFHCRIDGRYSHTPLFSSVNISSGNMNENKSNNGKNVNATSLNNQFLERTEAKKSYRKSSLHLKMIKKMIMKPDNKMIMENTLKDDMLSYNNNNYCVNGKENNKLVKSNSTNYYCKLFH